MKIRSIKFFSGILAAALILAPALTVSAEECDPSDSSGSGDIIIDSSSCDTIVDSSSCDTIVDSSYSSDCGSGSSISYSSSKKSATPIAVKKAAAEGKSVGEYTSNSIASTPGLPDAAFISQGGGAVINGGETNVTFTLGRATSGAAAFAVSQANAIGGTVLNVVNISSPGVYFDAAEVEFYVEGVAAGDSVAVYKSVKGEWVEVEVTEVSDNHVKICMDKGGVFCFIKC